MEPKVFTLNSLPDLEQFVLSNPEYKFYSGDVIVHPSIEYGVLEKNLQLYFPNLDLCPIEAGTTLYNIYGTGSSFIRENNV